MKNAATVVAQLPDGVVRTLKTETLDPLEQLWTPGDHPHAYVQLSVGTQYDFGRLKVTATVGYECDQKAKVVDEAGLLTFTKALEFLQDGMELLMVQPPAKPSEG